MAGRSLPVIFIVSCLRKFCGSRVFQNYYSFSLLVHMLHVSPCSNPSAKLGSQPLPAQLHHSGRLVEADICQESRPPSRIFRLQMHGGLAGRERLKQALAQALDPVHVLSQLLPSSRSTMGLQQQASSHQGTWEPPAHIAGKQEQQGRSRQGASVLLATDLSRVWDLSPSDLVYSVCKT